MSRRIPTDKKSRFGLPQIFDFLLQNLDGITPPRFASFSHSPSRERWILKREGMQESLHAVE
jgi:hypothetical protein